MTRELRQDILGRAVQDHQAGRLADAEAGYRRVIAEEPSDASALHLLGTLLYQMGQKLEALELVRRAIDLQPGVPVYHLNFGSMLAQEGRVQESIIATRKALSLAPGDAQAHFNLARLLEISERPDEAERHYRRAIELRNDFAAAHNNLGNVLYTLGRTDDAERSFRAAAQLRPFDAKSHKNLARALHDLGRLADAAAEYRKAMDLDPSDAEIPSNLGSVLAGGRDFDRAVEAYSHALALRPGDTSAMANLGNAMKETGRLDEAIAWYERALAAGGDVRAGDQLMLAVHLHPDYDPARIAEVHRAWEARFARHLAPLGDFYPNDPDSGRRLRIGYVSPAFADQIVGHCVLPLLAHHDHGAFEVFCYSDTRGRDWMTDRLRQCADVWRDIVGLSDDALTAQVRQDRIDVLVDLTMHMERNRLLVFARKPTPVQVTWIGYPSTTGLRTIDYRLSDPYLDPPAADGGAGGDEAFYAERTRRLPHTYWCYQPREDLPEPNELPALRNGFVTFGCLNSFNKVTEPTRRLWAAVLRRMPESRMLILAPAGSPRDRLLRAFEEEAIDASRIEFVDRQPFRQYMELYRRIDLGLDTFPYAGHTTTLDSLWMGVPVVSLAGKTAVSRGGFSILSNVGLPELCATSPDEFVGRATAIANDTRQLASLRGELRQRMARSPLIDGRAFAAGVEREYRSMWWSYCASRLEAMRMANVLAPVVGKHPEVASEQPD